MNKILLLFLLASTIVAQSPYDGSGIGWFLQSALPSSPRTAITSTVKIDQVNLSNTSGSAVTVTLTDNGTACNGAPCQIIPSVSIPANTVYTISLGGQVAVGGITWSASTANVVHAFAKGVR